MTRVLTVLAALALACWLAPTAALAQPECDECCETYDACMETCEDVFNECMEDCEQEWINCVNGCAPPGQPVPMWCRMRCQQVYNACAGDCEGDWGQCKGWCWIGRHGCLIVNECGDDYCD